MSGGTINTKIHENGDSFPVTHIDYFIKHFPGVDFTTFHNRKLFTISFLCAMLSFCWFYLTLVSQYSLKQFLLWFLMNILGNFWDFDVPIFFAPLWQMASNSLSRNCLWPSLLWIIFVNFSWQLWLLKFIEVLKSSNDIFDFLHFYTLFCFSFFIVIRFISNIFLHKVVYLIFKTALEIRMNHCKMCFSMSFCFWKQYQQ